jgi:signal transduction histidine kinase
LIDISSDVRYHQLIGEKKLLEQINVLVSHEMRNPLNSILAMITKIKNTIEDFEGTIDDSDIPKALRSKL